MNLSELRQKKLGYLFRLMDHDNNGTLEKEDIERFAGELADSRQYYEGSLARFALRTAYIRLWDSLADQIDADGDGHITPDEWFSFFGGITDEADFKENFVTPIERSLVAMLDADGDDKIRRFDYLQLARAYHIPPEEVEDIFSRMDTNNDGEISPEEAQQAIGEFFLSDDPEASGNWFFGDFSDATE